MFIMSDFMLWEVLVSRLFLWHPCLSSFFVLCSGAHQCAICSVSFCFARFMFTRKRSNSFFPMNMIVIKTKNCGRVYQQLVKDNKSILKSYVSVKEINSGHKFHHVKCLIMISNKLVKHLNKSLKIKFKDNYVFLEVIILSGNCQKNPLSL